LKRARRKWEVAGFGVALAILGAVATLAYVRIESAAETLSWVEHTHQVLQQTEQMSAAFSRTTAARRAYAVAGDPAPLAEVPELDDRLAAAIATLRASITDNPSQTQRLDALAKLFRERLSGLDASVARRRVDGTGGETAEGLTLSSTIRAAREELEAEEDRRLAQRDARTRRELAMIKLAEILGTFTSFAMLLAAFARLRAEVALRRRSEQILSVRESFLDSIVENIPDMLFVKDADQLRFERINQAGQTLLGIDQQELLGKNDFDFFPPAQAEFFQAQDRDALKGGAVVDIPEEPIQTKDGTRWLHTKKVPILEHGTPKYLLGISEDITERRQAAADLKDAKERAEAANRELEAFSYSVAHDLRAPLRAIDGFSQALQEDSAEVLDAQGRDYLERVRSAAQEMGRLIDGLLSLSRLTRADFVRHEVDLTRIALEVGERLGAEHAMRRVDLIVEDGLTAEGDARLLGAALQNLLANAWKFTGKRADARIEVGRCLGKDEGAFFVRDNGVGFEQAYAHKLFGAFQRLHGAGEFEGSGIGLATVQRVVRRHGGRVWAEGEVGRGATFYFVLGSPQQERTA
jgi:hypothetical protein